ncbi:hypothetical protein T06_15863 [Trichinella sp. T6]|nr:hypothetical protein T06_15863 [Trichinella sp. T6]
MIVAQRRLSHLAFTRDTTMDLFCSKPRCASWTGSQNHLPSQCDWQDEYDCYGPMCSCCCDELICTCVSCLASHCIRILCTKRHCSAALLKLMTSDLLR